jgi:hypothetical protein
MTVFHDVDKGLIKQAHKFSFDRTPISRAPSRINGVRKKLNPAILNALRAKENGFNFTLTPVI